MGHMAIDIEKIQDSPHLLDILIQMEDVLDSMDVYVFENWLDGEVVEGPIIRRYWLDFTLKYPYDKMPDPKAALRLLKHDVRVDFEEAREASEDPQKPVDEESDEGKIWLVKISMPRRLVVQISDTEHDFYDDEVDIDQVQDAKDSGMDDDETGLTSEDQDISQDQVDNNQNNPDDQANPK